MSFRVYSLIKKINIFSLVPFITTKGRKRDTRKRKRKQAGKGKEETESCRTESDRCLFVWNI